MGSCSLYIIHGAQRLGEIKYESNLKHPQRRLSNITWPTSQKGRLWVCDSIKDISFQLNNCECVLVYVFVWMHNDPFKLYPRKTVGFKELSWLFRIIVIMASDYDNGNYSDIGISFPIRYLDWQLLWQWDLLTEPIDVAVYTWQWHWLYWIMTVSHLNDYFFLG